MSRILVACLPFAGHVTVLSAVSAELVRRGHEVVAYTGAKYAGRFAGATWLPWERATDFDDADLAATFPAVGDGKGVRGGRANVEQVLLGTAAGQAGDVRAAAAREPFAAFVGDQLAFGAAIAAESLGLPWATVAVTPLQLSSRDLPPSGMPWTPATGPAGRARDALLRRAVSGMSRLIIDPKLNAVRRTAGLGPIPPGSFFDSLHSPHLVLAQGVPGLEYPRSDLPAHVHFLGRLSRPAAAGPSRPTNPIGESPAPRNAGRAGDTVAGVGELPQWWADLGGGVPVVHVTQGTLDTGAGDLLKPTLAALADEPVLVVATTGGPAPETLGVVPVNARVAAFVPHDELLPSVDVMVTNGGWNGVLAALDAGVPLVVAGGSLDKPEVARRVAWSGAGIDLRTGTPSPEKVRQAVRSVLERPEMRARAAELGAAITGAGGTVAAVDLIEGLLRP